MNAEMLQVFHFHFHCHRLLWEWMNRKRTNSTVKMSLDTIERGLLWAVYTLYSRRLRYETVSKFGRLWAICMFGFILIN